MSLFQKILDEKLKKQDQQPVESTRVTSEATVSPDLLRWINSTPLSKSFYFTVEKSSYSAYQKSREEILEKRNREELEKFNDFISGLFDSKDKSSAQFFFDKGARKFIDGTVSSLKKDYRKLAFQLHPDKNIGVTLTNQSHIHREFYCLSESYERLFLLFSRANKGK